MCFPQYERFPLKETARTDARLTLDKLNAEIQKNFSFEQETDTKKTKNSGFFGVRERDRTYQYPLT